MGIKIEDLTVTFKNKVTAINHANLEIPEGIFGLLGENGAGKTTLMRVLTTLLSPTGGTVTLDGMLYSEGNYEKIQKKIGYLPQEIDLYPSLPGQACFFKVILDALPTCLFGYAGKVSHVFQAFLYSETRIQVNLLGQISDFTADFFKIFFAVAYPV